MRHPQKGRSLLRCSGGLAFLPPGAWARNAHLDFWLSGISAPLCGMASVTLHLDSRWGRATCCHLKIKGQFQGKVVIFQMNGSTLSQMLFLEPLVTATGRRCCIRSEFSSNACEVGILGSSWFLLEEKLGVFLLRLGIGKGPGS